MSVETAPSNALRPNAIGFPAVFFQSVTTLAPSGAVAFCLRAAIPEAGAALPLAVLLGGIVVTLIAVSIGPLAKHLPSAGAYSTYISHSLGPEAGWMVGWLYPFGYIMSIALSNIVAGTVTDTFLSGTFGLSLGPDGWLVWAAVFTLASFLLSYLGIKFSANASIILGTIELAIFFALAIWLVVSAGSGNTFAAFNPNSALEQGFFGGWQGILHGLVFTFLAYDGFETAAVLAEETRDPRRNIPRAIVLSAVGAAVFYVFCCYAGVVGWGVNHIATFVTDPNPWGTMAQRAWGPFAFLIIFALLNSELATGNSELDAGSRVMYAMGRIRTLPAFLGQTNHFRAPGKAIILMMVVAAILTVWLGLVYGPTTAFALIGTISILALLPVYMASLLTVPLLYLREHRSEFKIVRHIVIPAIAFAVLAVVIYFQFVPAPPAPLNLGAPITALWIFLGLVVVIYLRWRAKERLAESTRIFFTDEEDVPTPP